MDILCCQFYQNYGGTRFCPMCLLLFIYSSVEQLTHTFTYSFLQALCILDCTRKNLHHFHFTTHVHGHWGRKLRPVVLNFRQSITWVVVNFRSCAFFACHLLTHVSTFVSVFIHNFFLLRLVQFINWLEIYVYACM